MSRQHVPRHAGGSGLGAWQSVPGVGAHEQAARPALCRGSSGPAQAAGLVAGACSDPAPKMLLMSITS